MKEKKKVVFFCLFQISETDFYKRAEIDIEEMNSTHFAVHIHPTPADLQDNIEMARTATGSIHSSAHVSQTNLLSQKSDEL